MCITQLRAQHTDCLAQDIRRAGPLGRNQRLTQALAQQRQIPARSGNRANRATPSCRGTMASTGRPAAKSISPSFNDNRERLRAAVRERQYFSVQTHDCGDRGRIARQRALVLSCILQQPFRLPKVAGPELESSYVAENNLRIELAIEAKPLINGDCFAKGRESLIETVGCSQSEAMRVEQDRCFAVTQSGKRDALRYRRRLRRARCFQIAGRALHARLHGQTLQSFFRIPVRLPVPKAFGLRYQPGGAVRLSLQNHIAGQLLPRVRQCRGVGVRSGLAQKTLQQR
jgi:hypothetical protein